VTQQILLPGFEPEPTPTDRLFFAVQPDAQAIARIAALTAELTRQHGLRGKPIAHARLHVTSCNLGDFPGMPQALLARASEGAALAAANTPAFDISFDTVLSFATRTKHRPCVLGGDDGVVGLQALYQRLALALRGSGALANPVNHTPHLTLLYDDVTVAPQAVEAVRWTARELVLLHSRIGQNLPYAVIGRWPLGV
jgi:2'-5' RNA ligase